MAENDETAASRANELSMTRRGAIALAGAVGVGLASSTATATAVGDGDDPSEGDSVIDGEPVSIAGRLMGASLAPETVAENERELPDGELRRGDVYFQFERAEPWGVKHGEFSGAQFHAIEAGENNRSTEFSPDGTRMYQLSRDDERVTQYELSEPWEVTTAGKVGYYEFDADLDFEEGWDESSGHGLWLRNGDGERMYVWNRRELYQYDIEGWDVTTAELVGFRNFDEEMTRGHDLDFKPDGSRLFIDDREERAVFQWDLGESWDIETAELGYRLDISANENAVRGLEFDEEGVRLFLVDTGLREVHEYRLETAWELSTAAFSENVLKLRETTNPRSITWRRDGTRFFITETDTGDVLAYDIDPDSELATMHVRATDSWARLADR